MAIVCHFPILLLYYNLITRKLQGLFPGLEKEPLRAGGGFSLPIAAKNGLAEKAAEYKEALPKY